MLHTMFLLLTLLTAMILKVTTKSEAKQVEHHTHMTGFVL